MNRFVLLVLAVVVAGSAFVAGQYAAVNRYQLFLLDFKQGDLSRWQ